MCNHTGDTPSFCSIYVFPEQFLNHETSPISMGKGEIELVRLVTVKLLCHLSLIHMIYADVLVYALTATK